VPTCCGPHPRPAPPHRHAPATAAACSSAVRPVRNANRSQRAAGLHALRRAAPEECLSTGTLPGSQQRVDDPRDPVDRDGLVGRSLFVFDDHEAALGRISPAVQSPLRARRLVDGFSPDLAKLVAKFEQVCGPPAECGGPTGGG
jgi:hypothetical protein